MEQKKLDVSQLVAHVRAVKTPVRSKLRLRSAKASLSVGDTFKKALADDLIGDVARSIGGELTGSELEKLRERVVTQIQVDHQFASMLAEQVAGLQLPNRMALYVASAELVLRWSDAVVASHGVLDKTRLGQLSVDVAQAAAAFSPAELASRFAKLQLENTELFDYVSRLMLRVASENLK